MAAQKTKTKNNKKKEQSQEVEKKSATSKPVTKKTTTTIKKANKRKVPKPGKKSVVSLYIVVLVAVGMLALYYYQEYNTTREELRKFKQNPQAAVTQELLEVVGTLVDLPKNEIPTIATVTNADVLRDVHPFFSKAQNGDRILIYKNNNRTILYRPINNKVIEAMSVTFENIDQVTKQQSTKFKMVDEKTQENDTVEPVVTEDLLKEPVSIAIYNGTLLVGEALRTKIDMEDNFDKFEVEFSDVNDAANQYEETTVVATSDIGKLAVDEVANYLGAKIGSAKEGEKEPNVDIIIFIGRPLE